MKKNWIKIILIAIFVVTNVATFIFAQGKIKIVEKIVTIYKEIGTKNAALPVDAGQKKTEVAFAGSGALKKTTLNFNDADYLIDSKESEETGRTQNKEGGMVKDSASQDEPDKKVTATLSPSDTQEFYDFSSDYEVYSEPSAEAVRVAGESIPIPQLPLFDTDFESSVDVGGYEDIALPQLPDLS
ncbi:MAG: hypothetical protein KKD29_00955 [Candidatus Omnitrophica bacterium]|nr:hypothetical protein [Candidatus Omnitrophota bacterium]MBU4487605.1 hypothetical protein [Candidatus Omnitrophota bacterium]MCG2705688.1 hypothetical protein [Candidatus Omnitrophota bacterium]